MDDARIKELSDEVLAQLGRPTPLELAQRALRQAPPAAAEPEPAAIRVLAVAVSVHPSHRQFDVPSGASDGRCVLEPGRACSGSGLCRTLGH
jgi:hypothetical protein